LFCDSHPRGVDRCDMRAGIGAGREICQTAGDMRAERAECGSMGLGRSCGGLGAGLEICAPMARGGIWEIRT
jgi:hypothetical protein